MSPIEEKVTSLLAELADARPGRGRRAAHAVRPRPPPSRSATAGPTTCRSSAAVAVASPTGAGRRRGGARGGGRRWPARARPRSVARRSSASVATSPSTPPLLGDGRMAVVVENQLHVADGPTGQVWQLTDTGRGEEVSNVSFSHDGEWVAFTIHDESGLWVSRWDGSERHRIGRSPSTYAWSPTDDQLAYATQDQVRVAQTDGSSRALEGRDCTRSRTRRVVWSPDGDRGRLRPYSAVRTSREALDGTADPEWGEHLHRPRPARSCPGLQPSGWRWSARRRRRCRVAGRARCSSLETLRADHHSLLPRDRDLAGGQRIASRTFGSPELVDCDTVELLCRRLPWTTGSCKRRCRATHLAEIDWPSSGDNAVGAEMLQAVSPIDLPCESPSDHAVEPASGLVLEPPAAARRPVAPRSGRGSSVVPTVDLDRERTRS